MPETYKSFTNPDVFAVVVDVLLWSSAMLQDVIIVSMINDKHATRFEHVCKVFEAPFVVPKVHL